MQRFLHITRNTALAALLCAQLAPAFASCRSDQNNCEDACRGDAESQTSRYRGQRMGDGATAAIIGLLGASNYSCLKQCQTDFDTCEEEESDRQREADDARRRAREDQQRQLQAQQRAAQDQQRQQQEKQRQQQEQQRQRDEQARVEDKAARWFAEGFEHFKRKEFLDAIDFFDNALKLMPTHAEGWYYAALTNLELKRTAAAEEKALGYLKLEPESPYANKLRRALPGLTALQDTLAWEAAKRADSFGAYEKYLNENPKGKFAEQAGMSYRQLKLAASNDTAQHKWLRDSGGCRIPISDPYPGGSISWSGECLGGWGHGRGTLVWLKNGKEDMRQEGELREGVMEGPVVGRWPDGTRFEGIFRNGARNGPGKQFWANGNRFEGIFKNDTRHGPGKIFWADGDRFEGEFQDGVASGNGTFTFADGEAFSGVFKNGCATIRGQKLRVGVSEKSCGF